MTASECNFQQLVEGMSGALLVLDEGLRVRYLNPAAEMLFGRSLAQARGQQLVALMPGPDDLLARLRHTLESGHPCTLREQELVLQEGRLVTADLVLSTLDMPGTGTRLLVELQPQDRHLRLSRDELNRTREQTIRQLVRGLAHEIKNPLGGLRGAAQLLEQELDDPALREYTGVIIREADRLKELLNRMLGPNQPPRMAPLNIHALLDEIRRLLQAEAGDRLRVIPDYDPSLPELNGDRTLLMQALLNIARNAMLALEGQEGGEIRLRTRIERKFTIGARRHRLVMRIDIIDNGPGIPEALRETLFFPMVTGRADGTGLGLSIAQSLIAQHHGLIEFESEPGETRFTVFLPYDTPAEESEA
ncbi:MAG: nitrogen regulation protein NR(II) [Gammaproteobacteria bacterium]|nr:MAG: nitrogen regulation protein NR(II) [Gammaproteobacteria bacterium]